MHQPLFDLANKLNECRAMAEGIKLDYIIPDPAESDVFYSQISIALANVLVSLCGDKWELVFELLLEGRPLMDAMFIAEDPDNRR
jgi:hypothetical protein